MNDAGHTVEGNQGKVKFCGTILSMDFKLCCAQMETRGTVLGGTPATARRATYA